LFLLDTNVVSELRKAARCDARVAAWQAAQNPQACFLSAITLLEIRLGIELARQRDRKQAEVLEMWLEQRVKPGFAGRILPVDHKVAEMCGRMHAERPRHIFCCCPSRSRRGGRGERHLLADRTRAGPYPRLGTPSNVRPSPSHLERCRLS